MSEFRLTLPDDLLERVDERRLAHPDRLSREEWYLRMTTYVLGHIQYDPSGKAHQHIHINETGAAPQ